MDYDKKEVKPTKKKSGLLERFKDALAKVDKESLAEFDKRNFDFYNGMRKAVEILKEEIKEIAG